MLKLFHTWKSSFNPQQSPSDRTGFEYAKKPHIYIAICRKPVERKPILHMALVIEICIFYYLSVNRWQIRNASSFENAASLVPSSRMKYGMGFSVVVRDWLPPICLRAAELPRGLPWQLNSEAKTNIFHWANCRLGVIQTCANWQMMCFQSSLWKLIEMKAGLWTFHLEACFIVVRHAQVYETEYRKALE